MVDVWERSDLHRASRSRRGQVVVFEFIRPELNNFGQFLKLSCACYRASSTAVTNNLYRFVVPAVAGPGRLVPLASLVDEKAGVTVTALRAAAERGRLRACDTELSPRLSG